MIKKIVGIVAGYIAMSVALFAMFSLLYTILGTTGAFQEGSYFVSNVWLILGFIVFFCAAALAGFVAVLIAGEPKAATWMGAVILALGIVIAISQIAGAPASMVREAADVPLIDAMNLAQNPVWAIFLNPLIGFAGAIFGGRLRK